MSGRFVLSMELNSSVSEPAPDLTFGQLQQQALARGISQRDVNMAADKEDLLSIIKNHKPLPEDDEMVQWGEDRKERAAQLKKANAAADAAALDKLAAEMISHEKEQRASESEEEMVQWAADRKERTAQLQKAKAAADAAALDKLAAELASHEKKRPVGGTQEEMVQWAADRKEKAAQLNEAKAAVDAAAVDKQQPSSPEDTWRLDTWFGSPPASPASSPGVRALAAEIASHEKERPVGGTEEEMVQWGEDRKERAAQLQKAKAAVDAAALDKLAAEMIPHEKKRPVGGTEEEMVQLAADRKEKVAQLKKAKAAADALAAELEAELAELDNLAAADAAPLDEFKPELASNNEANTPTDANNEANTPTDAPVNIDAVDRGVGIPAGCVDWVVEGGKLVPSDNEQNWRSSGNTVCKFGFELTQDLDNQQVDCHTLPLRARVRVCASSA